MTRTLGQNHPASFGRWWHQVDWFDGKSITRGPDTIHPHIMPNMAYVDGKMYILGSVASKEVEVLDLNEPNPKFTSLPPLPKSSKEPPCIVVVQGDIYFLGPGRTIQKYSIETNSWTLLEPLALSLEGANICFESENGGIDISTVRFRHLMLTNIDIL